MAKRILFTAPREVQVQDMTAPTPASGEVQVQLEFSAISGGTERANLSGSDTVSWVSGPEVSFPRTGGYSSAGVVTAVGEGVTSCKAGDRVALCWSTHSSVQVVKQENVYVLPDEVSTQTASLFNIATFPLAAIRKCGVQIGESALVMGMGILGLFALPLLRLAGAAPIIAVDPVAEKREKALACGADYALDPYAPDFAATVKRLTGGGVNVAIEVTGVGAGLNGALDCMARFGRVALLGCTRNSDFTVDYYRKVHGPGVQLIGAHTQARPQHESHTGWWTQSDDMCALIRLTACGRLDLQAMVDEVHTIDEALAVYGHLLDDPSFPLTQFDWRDVK
ncbi:MAG: zinc-binding alcohol dehydrogenase [Ruminococcaceae bacterium]|nr:zinc-binding alcohol dehydrogenase [Oscillospiraceae bacterium]